MPSWFRTKRTLRRQIDELDELVLQLRRTVMAQATAIDELARDTSELAESHREWRQIALNTADVFTAMRKADES